MRGLGGGAEAGPQGQGFFPLGQSDDLVKGLETQRSIPVSQGEVIASVSCVSRMP
jgi:hypothetical protein